MMIGRLRVQTARIVKDSQFHGDYVVMTELFKTICSEKDGGLVYPKKGIHITLKDERTGKVDNFYIGKYFITGEVEEEIDMYTEFSTTFAYEGNIYEIIVNINGNLIAFNEWLNTGDYEDGYDPDNEYTQYSKEIEWEKIDD